MFYLETIKKLYKNIENNKEIPEKEKDKICELLDELITLLIHYWKEIQSMNKARRKEIEDIIADLYILQDRIESVKDEEEEYLYNIPENLQSSERYEKAEESVDNLDSAYDMIDELVSYLNEAMEWKENIYETLHSHRKKRIR